MADSAGLLSRCTPSRGTEGSNPSLSANLGTVRGARPRDGRPCSARAAACSDRWLVSRPRAPASVARLRRRTASWSITSDPPGALVRLDDTIVGYDALPNARSRPTARGASRSTSRATARAPSVDPDRAALVRASSRSTSSARSSFPSAGRTRTSVDVALEPRERIGHAARPATGARARRGLRLAEPTARARAGPGRVQPTSPAPAGVTRRVTCRDAASFGGRARHRHGPRPLRRRRGGRALPGAARRARDGHRSAHGGGARARRSRELEGLDVRFVLGRAPRRRTSRAPSSWSPTRPCAPGSPYLRAARAAGVPVTSEIGALPRALSGAHRRGDRDAGQELDVQHARTSCSSRAACRAHLGGNIGRSLLESASSDGARTDVVVLELSSYQLEALAAASSRGRDGPPRVEVVARRRTCSPTTSSATARSRPTPRRSGASSSSPTRRGRRGRAVGGGRAPRAAGHEPGSGASTSSRRARPTAA